MSHYILKPNFLLLAMFKFISVKFKITGFIFKELMQWTYLTKSLYKGFSKLNTIVDSQSNINTEYQALI